MRRLVLLASVALVAVSTQAYATATGGSAGANATARLRVAVQPTVVSLYEKSTITVSGVASSQSPQVRLAGATYADGPTQWRSLRLVGHTWRGNLPIAALHGLYQV